MSFLAQTPVISTLASAKGDDSVFVASNVEQAIHTLGILQSQIEDPNTGLLKPRGSLEFLEQIAQTPGCNLFSSPVFYLDGKHALLAGRNDASLVTLAILHGKFNMLAQMIQYGAEVTYEDLKLASSVANRNLNKDAGAMHEGLNLALIFTSLADKAFDGRDVEGAEANNFANSIELLKLKRDLLGFRFLIHEDTFAKFFVKLDVDKTSTMYCKDNYLSVGGTMLYALAVCMLHKASSYMSHSVHIEVNRKIEDRADFTLYAMLESLKQAGASSSFYHREYNEVVQALDLKMSRTQGNAL